MTVDQRVLIRLRHPSLKTIYMQFIAEDTCREEVTLISMSEDALGLVSSKYRPCTFCCCLCVRGGKG